MRRRAQLPLAERMAVYLSPDQPVLNRRRTTPNVLTITPCEKWYSLWLFWDSAWNVLNWYVNYQSPLSRTSAGVSFEDFLLDIRLEPELSWNWKDEDEFEAACAAQAISGQTADVIRRAAADLTPALAASEWPFNAGWPDWRPDESWMPLDVAPFVAYDHD